MSPNLTILLASFYEPVHIYSSVLFSLYCSLSAFLTSPSLLLLLLFLHSNRNVKYSHDNASSHSWKTKQQHQPN